MVAGSLLVIDVGDMAVLVDNVGDAAIAIVVVHDMGLVAVAVVIKVGEVDVVVDDVR